LLTVRSLAPQTCVDAFALWLVSEIVATFGNVPQLAVGAVTVSGTGNVVVAVGVLIVPSVTEAPLLKLSVTVSLPKV
jgi:hypothetical protein